MFLPYGVGNIGGMVYVAVFMRFIAPSMIVIFALQTFFLLRLFVMGMCFHMCVYISRSMDVYIPAVGAGADMPLFRLR